MKLLQGFWEKKILFFRKKPLVGKTSPSIWNINPAVVFIGSGNHEKGTDFAHHNDHFDLDEDVLLHGSALYAEYAISFLKKRKPKRRKNHDDSSLPKKRNLGKE